MDTPEVRLTSDTLCHLSSKARNVVLRTWIFVYEYEYKSISFYYKAVCFRKILLEVIVANYGMLFFFDLFI